MRAPPPATAASPPPSISRSSSPSTTVHAPQSPSAQPSFVPVRWRCSRRYSSTVVVGAASATSTISPSRTKRMALVDSLMRASRTAIGGIAPRRNEQRNVVVLVYIRNAEVDAHDAEERRIRQRDALRTEIIGDMKAQRVAAGAQRGAFEQRCIRAPVRVGGEA